MSPIQPILSARAEFKFPSQLDGLSAEEIAVGSPSMVPNYMGCFKAVDCPGNTPDREYLCWRCVNILGFLQQIQDYKLVYVDIS